MTIDGVCDHTAGIPDAELHQHYTNLLDQGDAILYGRTTYQLMEYWRTVLEHPSEEQAMNDFARAIDRIPKIVFSRTLNTVDWESATLATRDLKDEVLALKQSRNGGSKPIFVGSRSLIIQLIKLNLIDEIIKEPLGGAHSDKEGAYIAVAKAIEKAYDGLKNLSPTELVEKRMEKYSQMGEFKT